MKRSNKSRSISFTLSTTTLARIRGGVVTDNKHPQGHFVVGADWNGVIFQPNDIKAL